MVSNVSLEDFGFAFLRADDILDSCVLVFIKRFLIKIKRYLNLDIICQIKG
jgi:hypothetical protein